jgi:type I restriction enzyme S subunit
VYKRQILEEMAQSLYREWFVNFRFPGHKNAKVVDSPLGPIPEKWTVRLIADEIELLYGKALKAEDRIAGQIPVYGSSGIVGYHDQAHVKGPGIIVGRKGNVGSVYWSNNDFYPIDTVYFVKTKVNPFYVYYNLKNQNFINNDAAVPGLSRRQAYSLPFLVPDSYLLEEFNQFVSSIFQETEKLELINTNLRKTRDLLLPKLISGEIDVSDINIEVPQDDTN